MQHVEMAAPSGHDVRTLVVAIAITLVGAWSGLRLIRGRRRMGLYLRKFGYAATTRTVSQALRASTGRSMRLVTLDDSMVAPIGAGAGRRRLAGISWLVASIASLLLLYYIFGGGYDADTLRTKQDALDNATNETQVIFAPVGAAFISGLILIVVVILICILAVIMMVGLNSHRAVRRAERDASQALQHEKQVAGVAQRLGRVSRRILAPRLMVVTVPTAFWQQAIRGLAGACDVIIIDVSQPTDALLWEVNNIKPMFNGRWVMVGAQEHVAALADPVTARSGTPLGLLARLIDGERVIAYGPTDADRAVFTRALRYEIAHLPLR